MAGSQTSIRLETLMWSQSGRVYTLVDVKQTSRSWCGTRKIGCLKQALQVVQEHHTINQLYSSKTLKKKKSGTGFDNDKV